MLVKNEIACMNSKIDIDIEAVLPETYFARKPSTFYLTFRIHIWCWWFSSMPSLCRYLCRQKKVVTIACEPQAMLMFQYYFSLSRAIFNECLAINDKL